MTLAYIADWVIAISAFLILPPIIWFTLRDAARDYREKKETDARLKAVLKQNW
jgi:hypothetical protein